MTSELDAFAAAAAKADPSVIARIVGEIPEEQLRGVLAGELGASALDEIFKRFPEYLDADATAGVDAVIGWRITGGEKGGTDRYVVVIEDGACRAGRDLEAEPRVTLELGRLELLKLVTGNANPPLMFLAGDLRLEGDVSFALELARFFRVPGGNGGGAGVSGGRVDPTAVDAVAVARLLRRTKDGELRERLRGDVRDLVLDQVFRRFPEYLDADKVKDLDAAIGWQITGRDDGGFDRFVVAIEHGTCRAGRDLDVKPRVSLRMDAVDFLKLVTGNANPVLTFVKGKLSIRGDLAFAAQLPTLFRIPSAKG